MSKKKTDSGTEKVTLILQILTHFIVWHVVGPTIF